MRQFFQDFKKYHSYIKRSAISELKSEVANSYLSWIWWILDPLLFMLVYVFITQVVFKSNIEYVQVFVFIGLMCWNFFNKCVLTSIRLVQQNKDIVTKVYIPKWVLIVIKMYNNLVKMLISFALCILFMFIYRVPFSPMLFLAFPVMAVLFLFTFGCSSIMMHCGVFVEDLHNVTTVLLRLMFYLSGIFYSIRDRVGGIAGKILLNGNPLAFFIDSSRRVMIYKNMFDIRVMCVWLVVGIILSFIGIKLIYRYENTYVKVIK